MIRVNLLPPEYRTVERTPVARLVVLLLGVLCVGGSAGYWIYFHMGPLKFWEDQREQLDVEAKNLKIRADRSRALQAEYDEYRKRRDEIEAIGQSRILWSKKLDQLADIIDNGGSRADHQGWLQSLSVTAPRGVDGGQIALNGMNGGAGLDRQNALNRALRETQEFFEDFSFISPPGGTLQTYKDDLIPEAAWKFTWQLRLKKPGWREAN